MSTRSRIAAVAIVLVAVLGYPLVTLVGGAPRFPTRDECARAATASTEDVQVVYARLDDPVAAEELLRELDRVGFVGASVDFDACGRWKVSYAALESFEQAEALAAQVRDAGFEARVEAQD